MLCSMRQFLGMRCLGYILTRESQEFLAHAINFLAVLHRQPLQNGSSPGRKRNQDDTTIRRSGFSADQPARGSPINETYNGVMALLQKFRQFGDCGFPVISKARDAKHELMLLRRNPDVACRAFAETQEFAQQISEVRELSQNTLKVLRFRTEIGFLSHKPYISYCDVVRNTLLLSSIFVQIESRLPGLS